MRKYKGHHFYNPNILGVVKCKHCDSTKLNVLRGKAPRECTENSFNEEKPFDRVPVK